MNNGVVEMGLNLIPAGYKQTEVGVIPEDWVIEKLGVIGKFKNGINKSADDFGYGYPFVNLMDVFGKPEIIGDEHFGLINSTELDKKEYSLVQGDVLFIRSSVKPSGVGLTTVVMSDLMDTVYSGFLIRFRTDNQLVIEFKKHCFYEESFRNRVICASTISANTNINQDSLKDIYLVYPSSKKEQTAIANALSDVDALISELEKLIAKKQAIKTATMQQLLTGRTRLPQFALREDGTPKGTKPSELGEILEDWEVYRFEQNFTIYAGGDVPKDSFSRIKTDAYPYPIFANAIQGRGLYGYTSHKRSKPDSVTITARGYLGHAEYRNEPFFPIVRLLVMEPVGTVDSRFATYAINELVEFPTESTGVPQLTASQVGKFSISAPADVNEQTAIATILSDMDAEIQALEQRLGKTRQIKQGMMQELLTGKTRLPYDKE
ncbi:restriction endonuclease subunit S [Proteus mirabilis]